MLTFHIFFFTITISKDQTRKYAQVEDEIRINRIMSEMKDEQNQYMYGIYKN